MAKQKNHVTSEWTPATPDEYAGQGGSYVYDPETGTRRQAPPDRAEGNPTPLMPEEQPTAED